MQNQRSEYPQNEHLLRGGGNRQNPVPPEPSIAASRELKKRAPGELDFASKMC